MKLNVCVFSSPLGWFGVVGQEQCVWRLVMGHRTAFDVWSQLHREFANESLVESNMFRELKEQLEDFASGKYVSFDRVPVRIAHRTQFQQSVAHATRAIPFGETVSYGELAARVGSPNAARAVGSVMSSNEIPIIIPCHRVLASGGRIGGFSAPQGTELKRRMLAMEARAKR